jgi:hypothetical protein
VRFYRGWLRDVRTGILCRSMSTRTAAQRFMASGLSLLFASCSATQPLIVEPSGPRELARYVLIIQELPDGLVKHQWELAKDFNLEKYQGVLKSSRVEGPIKLAAWQRDCDEELKKCLHQCMGSNLGDNWEHLFQPPSRKLGGKHAECRKRCWPPYEDCNRQNAKDPVKAAEFSTVDWLKRHREAVVAGTVIVIAGVAFVALTGASGGLLLAPVLLFVSADVHPERDGVAVKP